MSFDELAAAARRDIGGLAVRVMRPAAGVFLPDPSESLWKSD